MTVDHSAPLAVSQAAGRIRSSAIRDLLAVAEQPHIISLAGGLPSPATFPTEVLARAAAAATADVTALQYASSQGHAGLRGWVGGRRGVSAERVIITHGSQQAIELLTRLFVDPGTPIVVPDPCYLGALQAFRLSGADVIGVPVDQDGLRVDVLADLLDGPRNRPPAFLYLVSTVDNPTGTTLSEERAAALIELADRVGLQIIDDDPYSELRWATETPLPRLAARSDRVISLGTTSKVLAPGLRVGWAIAPEAVIAKLVILKQAVDLQTTTFTQHVSYRALVEPGFFEAHLASIRERYQRQAETLAAALRHHLGDRIFFGEPTGGMFLWARIDGVDGSVLLDEALRQGVAFVPGREFAVEPGPGHPLTGAVRLSCATPSLDELDEAARRLAVAVAAVDAAN